MSVNLLGFCFFLAHSPSLPPSPALCDGSGRWSQMRAHCDKCEQCACSRGLVYTLSYVGCLLALCAHLWFPVFCIYPAEHFEVSSHCRVRPTQLIIYVPLQRNRFQKVILLIVQYKFKILFQAFDSLESDPPHKIMRYWVYYSTQFCFWFPSDRNLSVRNDLYLADYQFSKGTSAGQALKYFTWFIGAVGPALC